MRTSLLWFLGGGGGMTRPLDADVTTSLSDGNRFGGGGGGAFDLGLDAGCCF